MNEVLLNVYKYDDILKNISLNSESKNINNININIFNDVKKIFNDDFKLIRKYFEVSMNNIIPFYLESRSNDVKYIHGHPLCILNNNVFFINDQHLKYCLKSIQKRYIIFKLFIFDKNKYNSFVIYDNEKRKLKYFKNNVSVLKHKKLIKKEFSKINISLSKIEPFFYLCPKEFDNSEDIKGYCYYWSLLIIDTNLSNPKYDSKELYEKLVDFLKDDENSYEDIFKKFKKYIRKYFIFINNYVYNILKIGSKIHNKLSDLFEDESLIRCIFNTNKNNNGLKYFNILENRKIDINNQYNPIILNKIKLENNGNNFISLLLKFDIPNSKPYIVSVWKFTNNEYDIIKKGIYNFLDNKQ